MEAREFLADYAQKAEKYLDLFFERKIKEAERISPVSREMVEIFRDHLQGGKKARGALMVLGYRLAGGEEEEKIYRASIFPEIIQSFLLIHDDIMDYGVVRRGKPTPQVIYAQKYCQKNYKGDAEHFGLSMAIDLGDLGMYLGQEALFESGFKEEKVAEVIRLSNKVYQEVIWGQALDIYGEVSGEFNEDYVLKIHLMKTAGYSVTAPLQFGAILAGAERSTLELLADYGNSVGVAFQLQDDVLGLFGEEAVVGKEAGVGDIREGKVTLLIVKALEKTEGKDRNFLKRVYGSREIGEDEVDRVQEIIKKSGSLDYSLEKARILVEGGKKAVLKITADKDLQETLCSLADFMVQRTS